MAHLSRKIKRCVMSITYQERKKRELIRYRRDVDCLKGMEEDQLDLYYINLKSQYEHKKNVLSIFLLTIIISFLMDVWKYFYNFIEEIMQLIVVRQGDDFEIAKVVFITTVIVIVFVTILILGILLLHTREMHQIYKKLIIVEEIRSKRQAT